MSISIKCILNVHPEKKDIHSFPFFFSFFFLDKFLNNCPNNSDHHTGSISTDGNCNGSFGVFVAC